MPPPVVADASLIFRFLLPNPFQQQIREQVDSWQQAGVRQVAPVLWIYEMTSAVAKAVQAGDIEEEESHRLVPLIHGFPIDLVSQDPGLSVAALAWSRRLRRANAYDSAYLALAEALQAELWTADRRLRNAARQSWIHYIGPEEEGI